jgi:hypothetical protein
MAVPIFPIYMACMRRNIEIKVYLHHDGGACGGLMSLMLKEIINYLDSDSDIDANNCNGSDNEARVSSDNSISKNVLVISRDNLH